MWKISITVLVLTLVALSFFLFLKRWQEGSKPVTPGEESPTADLGGLPTGKVNDPSKDPSSLLQEEGNPPPLAATMADREQLKRSGNGFAKDAAAPYENDPLYIESLINQALNHPDPGERESALADLGFLEPVQQVVGACLQALDDPVEEVRVEAVLALETLEAPASVPKLEGVARDDASAEVRRAAAKALAAIQRQMKELEEDPP